jgi:transcriptional regulator with XRE-family HTH domain
MFESNLKSIRNGLGISQLELARRAKMSPADVSLIENGKRAAYPGWRKRLAESLGVEEERIFPEVNEDEGI